MDSALTLNEHAVESYERQPTTTTCGGHNELELLFESRPEANSGNTS